ncbi:MAG: hypothetical protein A2844_01745 [Candidatus Ryanbacteria bacterium RIFCSPHIGHO2_01_FULL_48_80]|nr:MAG: hypothetical protein A2844_01745 [Candidatus Ryanbacteria bacterium RIFCSPHIGHO2_01_FULL_48_80]
MPYHVPELTDILANILGPGHVRADQDTNGIPHDKVADIHLLALLRQKCQGTDIVSFERNLYYILYSVKLTKLENMIS